MKFSDVVTDAKEKGFTEPDPRDDLSGTDVARKVLSPPPSPLLSPPSHRSLLLHTALGPLTPAAAFGPLTPAASFAPPLSPCCRLTLHDR